MEFLLKVFVLNKNSAEHRSDIAYLCRISALHDILTKEVIYDSLWEN